MKKILKFSVNILLISGFAYGAKLVSKRATDSFTITSITQKVSYETSMPLGHFSKEEADLFEAITDQKFFYLGKGSQCFAFVSDDGGYVIKFFRKNHFALPFFLEKLPFSFLEKKKLKKSLELKEEFSSYEIAFDQLREETGILFLHLTPSDHLNKKIIIVDRLNIEHVIDLDKIEFMVQKKGDLIYPTLNTLMLEKKEDEAKELISSLFAILRKRAEKGIVDADPNVSKNFACIGSQPIQIDVGRFRMLGEQEEIDVHFLYRMRDDFRGWLASYHPALIDHFDEEFQRLVQKGLF